MSVFNHKTEKRLIKIIDKELDMIAKLVFGETKPARLAVTCLFFNHIKIKGIIMEFTLSPDVKSLKARVQSINVEGTVLGADTFTELVITGSDDTLFTVTPDASDATLVQLDRITTSDATGTLSATAKNRDGVEITGTATVTIIGDPPPPPPPDLTLATGLQFVAEPTTPPVDGGTSL